MSVFCLDVVKGLIENFVSKSGMCKINITKKHPHINRRRTASNGGKKMEAKQPLKVVSRSHGEKSINEIILRWAVQKVNKEKGYEFVRINEDKLKPSM